MTKIHETFYRESIDKIKLFLSPSKGELTVVISEKYNKQKHSDFESKKQILKYLKKYSLKDVVIGLRKRKNF